MGCRLLDFAGLLYYRHFHGDYLGILDSRA
jgi:hypothetical protein